MSKRKHLLFHGKYPKRSIFIASTPKGLKYAIYIVSTQKGPKYAYLKEKKYSNYNLF